MKNLIKLLENINLSFYNITYIIIFILPVLVFSQGSLTNTSFFSPSLNMDQNIQLYLPEGYNPEDTTEYPVVYFLHGAFGDHTSGGSVLSSMLNDLIDNSTISPMIIVKPDGSVEPWAGSCFTKSKLYGNFEDYIVIDLVSFIDSTYKSIPSREGRAIWGYSMGGYGSMKLALKNPDIYCGVAAHSGPLDFSHWVDWTFTILSENGGAPVSSYVPTLENIFTYFFYTLSGAFSPNLNNTPYPVDFPLNSLGNFIDSTYTRWVEHDPVRLASDINQDYDDLAIYFDCGEQDELLLYPFNIGFKDSLDLFGLKSIFKSYEGTHDNKLTERFPIALSFIDSVMKIPTGINKKYKNSLSTFILSQNYPNPFNPTTTIEFSLPKSGFVELKVFNILGKEVSTLVSIKLNQGKHTYTFDGKNLASGVYYYQLVAGDYRQVKKMIILR